MPRSYCFENCSNNAKSQPNLNFYIFPSDDKQWRRRWRAQSIEVFALLSS